MLNICVDEIKKVRNDNYRQKLTDIVLDNPLYHLGDNVFSNGSANCNQFKAESIVPYVHKEFTMKHIDPDKGYFL